MKLQTHERIVTLYDVFENQTEVSIVIEYSEGSDLFEAIRGNDSYSESDAAVLMKHICEGVEYMHSKNIVHRFLRVLSYSFIETVSLS